MINDYIEKTHGSRHTVGLQINLIKRTYVFPWSQFIFAEGDTDEIRMAFSTHDVVISGGGLNKLLTDIAFQRLSLLEEPVRAESFASSSERQITRIFIKKMEQEG
jgi:hypothetical protein